VESEDLKITMNALQAGALAVIEKPVGTAQDQYESLAERLCTQLAIMSQVKVVRRRVPRETRSAVARPGPLPISNSYRVLGITASTGGPNALMTLLDDLGQDFPLPIAVVQHITPSFLKGFASWLASVCPFPVEVIESKQAVVSGRVYLAAADRHLRVEGRHVWVDAGEPVCCQRPSGTVLFQSMAKNLGPYALGVLLTGMGEDGADGLLALRDAGGYTIAEDASTAVVYGMPAAAMRLGAACESLALPDIGPHIRELIWRKPREL
jgi:two-component system chemotaxis response regulator CheB